MKNPAGAGDPSIDELLALYLAGEMDDERRALFERLLQRDPALRARHDRLRGMPKLADLPEVAVPASLLEIPARDRGSPRLARAILDSRWTWAVAGALAASLLILVLPAGPGGRGGGNGTDGWTAAASLWTRQGRLLLLGSSRPAHVWVARLDGPNGVRVLEGGKWLPVEATVPRALDLGAPAADIEAEWFVAVFASESADLKATARAARKALEEQLPRLLQADTKALRAERAKELAEQLTRTTGKEVRVAVCYWKAVE